MAPNRSDPAPRCSLTSRLYQTEADLEAMRELLMAARSQTDDWHFWHVGELAWAFFMVACHLNPREQIRLWHDRQGQLVGYAMLDEEPSFDCQVLPEDQGSGIETEALVWAEGRLAGLRQQDAATWGRPLVSGARQNDRQRIRFLEQHGFRRGEYTEVNMLRSLTEPIPAAALPPGCQVRAVLERVEKVRKWDRVLVWNANPIPAI